MKPPRAWLCFVRDEDPAHGHPGGEIKLAHKRDAARYDFFLEISDCRPDLRLIDVRARLAERGPDPAVFDYIHKYYGRQDIRHGVRARVIPSGVEGYIIGMGGSYVQVLLDNDIGVYAHPAEIETLPGGAS